MKRLTQKADVKDTLLRLDLLTKVESLIAVEMILEVADRVEDIVKEIKVLAEGTDDKLEVQVLERVTYGISHCITK
jgi:hypothetical protein